MEQFSNEGRKMDYLELAKKLNAHDDILVIYLTMAEQEVDAGILSVTLSNGLAN